MDETFKEIFTEINKLQSKQLEFVKIEVQDIIDNEIQDEKTIEHTFDKMLDLTYWFGNDIEKLYYSLLNYYAKLNMEASKDYESFYLEIIQEREEEDIESKSK